MISSLVAHHIVWLSSRAKKLVAEPRSGMPRFRRVPSAVILRVRKVVRTYTERSAGEVWKPPMRSVCVVRPNVFSLKRIDTARQLLN